MVIEDDELFMSVGATQLSNSVTVGKYKQWVQQADEGSEEARRTIVDFIIGRFDERYFNPVMNSCSKHGFTMMAVGCLVIETLEAFYQGLGDTTKRGECERMFKDFFGHVAGFSCFADSSVGLYKKIRCGILHQAEARGGWRIRRDGPLLDVANRTINAEIFILEWKKAVAEYASQLLTDAQLWSNFKKKMEQVCENCIRQGGAPAN